MSKDEELTVGASLWEVYKAIEKFPKQHLELAREACELNFTHCANSVTHCFIFCLNKKTE